MQRATPLAVVALLAAALLAAPAQAASTWTAHASCSVDSLVHPMPNEGGGCSVPTWCPSTATDGCDWRVRATLEVTGVGTVCASFHMHVATACCTTVSDPFDVEATTDLAQVASTSCATGWVTASSPYTGWYGPTGYCEHEQLVQATAAAFLSMRCEVEVLEKVKPVGTDPPCQGRGKKCR